MKQITKRLLSLLLVLVMVCTMLPTAVFADEADVTPVAVGNVAKVGNTEYATIDEAIAAWTDGTTLTLLANVTLSDVVKLKSTEHHTLDLGTYTMTAASGKNAIEITCEGRSSASYAITVNADAENPGGITATGKACIYYSKSGSTKDRPIIRIYNGVFNGSYSINSKSNGNTNCPQIWIYGGTFNGNVNLTKNMLRVFGGTFNGWINCTGDSSAYREISGGRFKSWQFMTADADNKFWVGTSKANYNVGLYVDDEGYLVVGGDVITKAGDKFEASTTNYDGWSSYLKYSSAATNGLYYTDADKALQKGQNSSSAKVTIYAETLDMAAYSSYKGTIVAPEGKTLKITNAPEGLKTEGNVVIEKPAAKIGDVVYKSLDDAFTAAAEGDTITLLADATPALTSQRAITKAAVIDLNGNILTLTEDDLYFGTTTFENGTIVVDSSVRPSTAVFWMFANQTLTFDAVKIVATGVTGTYLIGLDGNNSDLNLLNGSEIFVDNTTALDLDIICVNASTGNDIVIDDSKVNVTNLDGRVFFRGNYTVSGNSDIDLSGITKAGFRIEAGQTLTIADTATVDIVGEPRDGGIHLTDVSATYTKAGTATVNATVNKPGLKGSGTEEDPYLINNIDDLKWFRDKVDNVQSDRSNQFLGKYVKLTADIDMAGINWNPIGEKKDHGSFMGIFDGGDYTISNLYVEQAGEYLGLFAYTGSFIESEQAVIKNLTLNNVTVKSTNNSHYVGGLVGNATTTNFKNIHVTGTVEISGRGYIGGIVGHGYSDFDNVSVKATNGTISSTFWCAGGVIGYLGEGSTIENAVVEGLTIKSAAGGLGSIVGMASSDEGTQPCTGKNLSAKNVAIQTYTGDFGNSYAEYSLGYLIGGDTSVMTGSNTVENVTFACSNGTTNPDVSDAVASIGNAIYFDLQSALDAAAGGNIVLLRDVELSAPLTVPADADVTLDLNGKTVNYNSTTQGEAMITNKGTLTINDISSPSTGVINYNYTGAADSTYGKGNYTISNGGTLTVNGGKITIANLRGHAKYPIDNNSTSGDAILVINGGHLYNYNTSAIRQFCNSTTNQNSVTINGGLIEGYCAIWVQNPGSKTVNGSLTITGGEVKTTAAAYVNGTSELKDVTSRIYCTTEGGEWSEDSSVSITGGTINENVYLAEDAPADITIGAATFNGYVETPVTPVAEVGGKLYLDLHEAMVACKAGETVTLLADVDLAGTEWEPVAFKGTFDGGKYDEKGQLVGTYVIKNLTINKPGVSNTGFITSLNGTFKNVTFTNPTVTGGENTGVVAGRAGGSAALAENITVNGTIKVETTHSGYARAAAIVGGWAYGNYKNITVDGGDKAVSYIKHTGGGDGRYVAGIVGHADDVESYVNCTVKNITISGGWLCGGIAGPGPSDGLATGCAVENVNMGADYSGGMFGWYFGDGTIEDSSIKDVTFTDGSTNNGAIGGYSANEDATVTNVTIENVKNADGAPLLDHVAKVNGKVYFTLQEAINAANGATVTLVAGTAEEIQIADNANVVIDLGGKKLNGCFKPFKGNLTISNGTIDNDNADYSAIEINAGVLTLTNVNVTSQRHGVRIDGAVTATIDGGEYKADATSGTRHAVNISGASNVTIKSGTFVGPKGTTMDSGSAVCVQAGATVAIEGGNFSGGKRNTLANNGALVLTGGTFDQNPAKYIPDGYIAELENGVYTVRQLEQLIINVGSTVTTRAMAVETINVATMDEAVAAAKAAGADYVIYKISGSVELTTGGSHGILDLGKNVVIEGVTPDAKLTIVGGGVPDIMGVTFKNITLADEGTYLPTANEFMYQNYIDCSFENVTFVDGIRLSGKSTLTNCTVDANTTNEYAIWLDEGEFTMTGTTVTAGNDAYGLLKSDEVDTITLTGNTFEYLGNANKEALNVKGAKITATGNTFIDCTKGILPADKTNYAADGTTVLTEASVSAGNTVRNNVAKIGDKKFETLDAAFAAAQAGDEVKILVAGTYALNTSGKNITITGAVDGVVFDNIGAKNMGGASVTFNNVTFDYYPNVNYTGLQHSGNLVYNNCTINGQVFLYGTSETFNNCTFNQTSADAYNVWTYGAKEAAFNSCTFNSAGKSVLIYSESADVFNDVTVTNSTFKASAAADGKAAIEMDSSLTAGIKLTIDAATTATGFGTGNVSGNSLWNNKKGNNTEANNDITVVVDNVTVLAPVVAKVGDVKYFTLSDAIKNADKNEVILLTDVTENIELGLVRVAIDLDGHTLNGYIKQSANADGSLSISNGSIVNTNSSFSAIEINKGELHLTNVKISSARHAVRIDGLVTATINGGEYTLNATSGTRHAVNVSGKAQVTIEDGTFIGPKGTTMDSGAAVNVQSEAKVTIKGGSFSGGKRNTLASSGNLTVTGGTFDQDPSAYVADGYIAEKKTEGYVVRKVNYVAEVNGVKYETLQAAINDAENGQTVKLLTDITLTNADIVKNSENRSVMLNVAGRAIKLDLNGKCITVDYNETALLFAVVHVEDGASLTVTGNGKIDVPQNGINIAYMFWKRGTTENAGTLTIKNGTYHMDDSADSMVYTNGTNIVTVEGGTFKIDKIGTRVNGFPWIMNAAGQNERYIVVTGGTYNWNIFNQHWRHEVQCGGAYAAVDNGDGTWTVEKAVAYVCDMDEDGYIYEVGYKTLAEAIAAADANEKVVLVQDIAQNETINITKAVVLDLNGKTVSGTCSASQAHLFMVNNGATLTIKDSSTELAGKITYAGNNSTGWIVDVEGALVLESGTLELTGTWNIGYAVDVRPNAWGTAYTAPTTFVMNGGNIISSDGAVRVASSSADTYTNVSASFTMNGGKIDAGWDGVFVQQSNAAWDVLNVTINGGTIESDLNPIRLYGPAATSYVNGEDCVDINLNGGTLTYTGTETREWLINGILRTGGGATVDEFLKDTDVIASAAFAGANVANGYAWVETAENTYKLAAKLCVAKIGDVEYESLSAAIAAAKAGNTITFIADITESVTVNKSLTIDGAGYTYTGKMSVDSVGNVTIKNVNFDGNNNKAYDYAVETYGKNSYLTIQDCTAKNYYYGFVELSNSTASTTVKNVTVSDMNYGVKINYSNAVVIENAKINARVAAVLNSNYGEKTITIKNSDLSILGTWARTDNAGNPLTYVSTYVFEGENTIDSFVIDAAIDNFKLADVNSTLTAPNDITVTTDVEGYEVQYADGKYSLVEKVELFKLAGANVKIDSSLTMFFYIPKAELESGVDYYATITKANVGEDATVVEIPMSEWESYSSSLYRVAFDDLMAYMMNDEIKVQIFSADGTAVSEVWTDSISIYAHRIYDKQNDKYKTALVDMLNYGAACQTFFGYDAENLANKNLTEDQKNMTSSDPSLTDSRVKGENYYGSSLTCDSTLILQFYFKNINENMTAKITYTNAYGRQVTETIAGSDFNKRTESLTGVKVGLAAYDAQQLVTCEVYDGDVLVASASDSVESYVARMSSSNDVYITIMKFALSSKAALIN